MKNYFKKFSIMFVMLLVVMLGCTTSVFASDDVVVGMVNLNNTVKNSAKLGDELKLPEIGWKRYDDTNQNIDYSDGIISENDKLYYEGSEHYEYNSSVKTEYCKFSFYGSKLRLIDAIWVNRTKNSIISFDGGKTFEKCSGFGSDSKLQSLFYEKTGLEEKIHDVVIEIPYEGANKAFCLDAIDIDGYLINPNASISLNKTSMDLTVGDSKQLTATTTPAGAEVKWTSDNTDIVTVDDKGNVTGIKEGKATITAKIKGSETKATCVVTVTPKGADPKPPVEPTGDGTLYIEMVDGNIKQAQNLDVADFIKWFKNRDLDNNDNPIYKIKNAKGNFEYLVHDKIVGFEVR